MAVRRGAATDPNQLWLNLGDRPERPPPTAVHGDSVFFAIRPDPETALRAEEFTGGLQRRYGLPGTPRPARVLHMSLIGLGDYQRLSRDVIATARHAASTVRRIPFVVALDRVRNFNRTEGYTIVLDGDDGVVGFLALYQALGKAMEDVGLKLDRRAEVTPHLTLHYSDRSVPEAVLDEPIAWTVREFVLVRSRYGNTRHDCLDRWPLRE